jgi:hypothetical protein
LQTENFKLKMKSGQFIVGQEVNVIESSRWPAAAAAGKLTAATAGEWAAAAASELTAAAAAGGQRSSREAQISRDAFEPIPTEEVQDHFKSGTAFSSRFLLIYEFLLYAQQFKSWEMYL